MERVFVVLRVSLIVVVDLEVSCTNKHEHSMWSLSTETHASPFFIGSYCLVKTLVPLTYIQMKVGFWPLL